eukprot:168823-Amphidinium_carterae.1
MASPEPDNANASAHCTESACTLLVWPFSVCVQLIADKFHSLSVQSALPLTAWDAEPSSMTQQRT